MQSYSSTGNRNWLHKTKSKEKILVFAAGEPLRREEKTATAQQQQQQHFSMGHYSINLLRCAAAATTIACSLSLLLSLSLHPRPLEHWTRSLSLSLCRSTIWLRTSCDSLERGENLPPHPPPPGGKIGGRRGWETHTKESARSNHGTWNCTEKAPLLSEIFACAQQSADCIRSLFNYAMAFLILSSLSPSDITR